MLQSKENDIITIIMAGLSLLVLPLNELTILIELGERLSLNNNLFSGMIMIRLLQDDFRFVNGIVISV